MTAGCCGLTNHWSAAVTDKVPCHVAAGGRRAQLNRWASAFYRDELLLRVGSSG